MPRLLQSKEKEKLDAAIARLSENQASWPATSFPRRRELLERCLQNTLKYAAEWVQRAVEKKGLAPDTSGAAEEILGGPVVLARHLRLMIRSLDEIERDGVTSIVGAPREIEGSCLLAAQVFPETRLDTIAMRGISAEVWMAPEVTRQNFDTMRAGVFRQEAGEGSLCLVLAAGNVSSIGPLDALYKLFHEHRVVILKMNPVNDYLGFVFERILAPLTQEGVLAFAYGGLKIGKYLSEHEAVDSIHLTGSHRTFDAIVWGPGEEGETRRAEGERYNEREISAELGNVSPVIVVPGRWSKRELEYQAENIASTVTNNGSFNCNATKLLVTAADWPQREAFLDAIRRYLTQTPERKAYYPGAHERYRSFLAAHPEAEKLSRGVKESVVPWTLIPGLDASNPDEICFREEAFCGLLAEVPLQASSASDFLMKAAELCNERVFGSLNVGILIPPKVERRNPGLLDRAILELRYGTVAINIWAALGYALAVTPWGAFPGHGDRDIQSGRGWVHNTLYLDRPSRSVVRGPFSLSYKLPYFASHRTACKIAWQLLAFEAAPSYGKLPALIVHSLLS